MNFDKKKINEWFVIDSGSYPFKIPIFFGEKEYCFETIKTDSSFKYLSENDIHHIENILFDSGAGGLLMSNLKNRDIIIWIKKLPETILDLTVIHHELLHAVFRVHEFIGTKYHHKGEESYTYLFQHYTNQVYNLLNLKFTII